MFLKQYEEKIKYIRLFIPYFNATLYLIILAVLTVGLSYLYRKGGVVGALTFGLVGFSIGLYALDIVSGLCRANIKKIYIRFLSIYTGYLAVADNPLHALKNTSDHIGEPVKTILKNSIYLFETGQIGEDEMYKRIISQIDTPDFKTLFTIVSTTDKHGGNIAELLDKLRSNSTESYKIEQQVNTTAKVGIFIIFFMIFLNLVIFNSSLNTAETQQMLTTTMIGNGFMILNFACIIASLLIARWMIK